MSLIDLASKAAEITRKVEAIAFADVKLSEEFMSHFGQLVHDEQPAGYTRIDWAIHTAKITTSSGKVFYIPNILFPIASILAEFMEHLDAHRSVFVSLFSSGDNATDIAKRLKDGGVEQYRNAIEDYFEMHALSDAEKGNFLQFVSDYSSWGGGKTVDRNDYYVSPLLKAGGLLAETSTSVAELAKIFSSNRDLRGLVPVDESHIAVEDDSALLDKDKLIIPKPFLLLAGISGTGKTRFVIEQAAYHDARKKNLCVVPVRPDWHEPSDLLGYVSRISGMPEYVATDMLRFLVKAWEQVAPEASSEGVGELDLTAHPYWLCLDEMNLAPVEQYFSDYLSALETRKFNGQGYECNALVSASLVRLGGDGLRREVGLGQSPELWGYFCQYGIGIPPNLIVAGTVNMDETTHAFSRKVIDRALTLDFGEFFPNNVADFFTPSLSAVVLGYPTFSQVHSEHPALVVNNTRDATVTFFNELNSVLARTPFELGFRALNELLMLVVCFKPEQDSELQAVWDDFLMMKVLPRLEGDEAKLTRVEGDAASDVLESLEIVIGRQFSDIWLDDRKDFLRSTNADMSAIRIPCRSRLKLEWMRNRLEFSSFTSFWP